MHRLAGFVLLVLFLSSCEKVQGFIPPTLVFSLTVNPTQTTVPISSATEEVETLQTIPTFTSLTQPCATPAPDELNDFIKQSITIKDNGKIFTTHITSRFWIYLDDRIYPVSALINAIPKGLIGYISNGSIRGPQCYPVMFEALEEGKQLLQVKDFQIWINVDDHAPESALPLP